MPKWSKRVDANQATLVRAFEGCGVSVLLMHSLGGGAADLLCGFRNRNHLVEAKNPETAYGRRGLNENQRKFNRRWNGEPMTSVSSVEDVEVLVMKWCEEVDGDPKR